MCVCKLTREREKDIQRKIIINLLLLIVFSILDNNFIEKNV